VAHAEEDKKRREETEARNNAEQLVYSTEKFLADNGDKIPADGRGDVDAALEDLKSALKADSGVSAEDLAKKSAKLSEESQKVGTAMYAAASEADGATGDGSGTHAGGSTGGAAQDDVVDAEVVEDDEESK
jgi:molecular chaperone DnaK